MIYRKYHRYLYALAMKYLKNTHLAEDAVQHVFVSCGRAPMTSTLR